MRIGLKIIYGIILIMLSGQLSAQHDFLLSSEQKRHMDILELDDFNYLLAEEKIVTSDSSVNTLVLLDQNFNRLDSVVFAEKFNRISVHNLYSSKFSDDIYIVGAYTGSGGVENNLYFGVLDSENNLSERLIEIPSPIYKNILNISCDYDTENNLICAISNFPTDAVVNLNFSFINYDEVLDSLKSYHYSIDTLGEFMPQNLVRS